MISRVGLKNIAKILAVIALSLSLSPSIEQLNAPSYRNACEKDCQAAGTRSL